MNKLFSSVSCCVAGVLLLASCGGSPAALDRTTTPVPSSLGMATMTETPTPSATGLSDPDACALIREAVPGLSVESFAPVVKELARLAKEGARSAKSDDWGDVYQVIKALKRTSKLLPQDLVPADVPLSASEICSDKETVNSLRFFNVVVRKLNSFKKNVSMITKEESEYRSFWRYFGGPDQKPADWSVDKDGIAIPPGGWRSVDFQGGVSDEFTSSEFEGFDGIIRDSAEILKAGGLLKGDGLQ